MKVALASALFAIGSLEPRDGPPAGMPEAQLSDFDFAKTWDGPCTSTKSRREPDPAFAEACKQWSEPQYFHGVWEVGFEASNFTFMGKMDCYKMQDHSCIDLIGEALPKRPRDDCNREFELKFVGRRTPYPVYSVSGGPDYPIYVVKVDRVISARLLPAPYNWQCPGIPDDE